MYDSNQIVNELGKYFANIGEVLAERTKASNKSIDFYNSKIIATPVTMFLHPMDETEVSKLIDDLKAKNSSGQDNISNCLLKESKKA